MAGNLINLVMVNYGCGSRHNWGWVTGGCFMCWIWHIALRVCVFIKDHKINLWKDLDQLDCIVRGEDSVARRPSRCFRNPPVPGWSPTLATCWIYCGISKFRYPVMLVNSQLVASWQLGFLILLCSISSINKHLDFHMAGMITLKLTPPS